MNNLFFKVLLIIFIGSISGNSFADTNDFFQR